MSVTRTSNSDIHKTLRHHDSQITKLDADVSGLRSDFVKFTEAFYALRDQMVAASAQVRPGIKEVIGIAVGIVVLFSAVCAGIVWIVTALLSQELGDIRTEASKWKAEAITRERRITLLEQERTEELKELRRWLRMKALEGALAHPP